MIHVSHIITSSQPHPPQYANWLAYFVLNPYIFDNVGDDPDLVELRMVVCLLGLCLLITGICINDNIKARIVLLVLGGVMIIVGICLLCEPWMPRVPVRRITVRFRNWYRHKLEVGQMNRERGLWKFWSDRSAAKDAGYPLSTMAGGTGVERVRDLTMPPPACTV